MPKTRIITKTAPRKQSKSRNQSNRKRLVIQVSVVAVSLSAIGIATFASNNVLHGRVSISAPSEQKTKQTSSDSETRKQTVNETDLTNRYGSAASSSTVAAAIREAENKNSNVERNAKSAADRHEALQHGSMTPGADPMLAIMHGYVPPGMTQEQASILYRSVPHLPKMQRAMSADQIASMADPEIQSVFPNQHGINAANQQILEEHFRERMGPVYLPPLHRSHTRDHQGSIREMTDASGNIVSQYSYDSYGQQTKVGGSGPDADFGFHGYYVHQRSGLNLAPYRAYSPKLGRWLSRDPIEERGGVNAYAFVNNDPMNHTDPTGAFPLTAASPRLVSPRLLAPRTFNPNPFSGEPVPILFPQSGLQRNYNWPQYIGPYASQQTCEQAALDRFFDCMKNVDKYPEPKSCDFSPGARVNLPGTSNKYRKCLLLYRDWMDDCFRYFNPHLDLADQ